MTRSASPSLAPRRRVAAALTGLIVVLGVGVGAQPVLAQDASHTPTQVVAASSATAPTSASVVPALPPDDPRYILARLDSEYLIELARAWYHVQDAAAQDGVASSAP